MMSKLFRAGLQYAGNINPNINSLLARSALASQSFKPELAASVGGLTHTFLSVRLNNTTPVVVPAEKKLFTTGTPGVSATTKEAFLCDMDSRCIEFIETIKYIRTKLIQLADVSSDEYTCVPLQGPGTFGVEAVLSTVIPREKGKVLVLENGVYSKRQCRIMDVLGIPYHKESFEENEQVDVNRVADLLRDGTFNIITIIHCETSSGIINPIEQIGSIIHKYAPGAIYLVDAMSTFGGVPLKMKDSHIDYLVGSANKCIEGVPGFSYAICRTKHLLSCTGQARSFCLDLLAQYMELETTGLLRFTPPTHVMLAFKEALQELEKEGGIKTRYRENQAVIQDGMKAMGFSEFLTRSQIGYIVTSYRYPKHKNFDFERFCKGLSDRGQVIYPVKDLDADCFRISHIGHLFPADMKFLLTCIEDVCTDMGLPIPLNCNHTGS